MGRPGPSSADDIIVSRLFDVFQAYVTFVLLRSYLGTVENKNEIAELMIDTWRKNIEGRISEQLDSHDSLMNSIFSGQDFPKTSEMHMQIDEIVAKAESAIRSMIKDVIGEQEDTNKDEE